MRLKVIFVACTLNSENERGMGRARRVGGFAKFKKKKAVDGYVLCGFTDIIGTPGGALDTTTPGGRARRAAIERIVPCR